MLLILKQVQQFQQKEGISLHRLFNDLRMPSKKSMKTKKTQNMAFQSEQLFFEH